MKNLKSTFAAAALILGLGSALLTSAATQQPGTKTWGHRTDGSYVDLTGENPADYRCTGSMQICKAVYPDTQDPNVNPANPISTVAGEFSGL
ncbi:hypothetical protein GWR56_13770 [Mucilaginibacter sp. 14171R-50]|uniref:hypothetical protein n=1 Tax=Mucilaginibacter sp. 14171R-50 TaxID=2703789 RepID=UPI00138B1DF7|nr:hypothetical protein [Mucilaginibacter sp. 14171R-50]QHS56557.1 hypothetical protein GWR56_13770 [Mucilaginibacter sp. 14171R-50]